MVPLKEYIKHLIKIIIGKKDLKLAFVKFENEINVATLHQHDGVISWAEKALQNREENECEKIYLISKDPVINQGFKLRSECLKRYYQKYRSAIDIKILIHVPTVTQSVAGHSLFNNLAEGLEFLGIYVQRFHSGEDIKTLLEEFRPTVFLTSDNDIYLNSINWKDVHLFRINNSLKLGLTASLEENGNTPLEDRFKRAEKLDVGFYYSFHSKEYVSSKKEYDAFINRGYQIINIEFGANPLLYYPLPLIKRDLDYVFLASSNPSKRERYFKYLKEIVSKYSGFIDGPGWTSISKFKFNKNRDRYIYARGRVGINLHIDMQINSASELNERTYILAMCAIPQLIDNPPLLFSRFSRVSMFSANNPKEYVDLFEYILNNPDEAKKKALIAQNEVFEKHTSFQRAEELIKSLQFLPFNPKKS
jgi:hypothetical protein